MNTSFVLIVIDMQVDSFGRVPTLTAQRAPLVAAINALVAEFGRANLPVVWVRQEFAADPIDAFLDTRRHSTSITIAGATGCMILPELDQRAGDHMIVKKRYSAFFGTGLDDVLAPLASTTIVLAGINTHACIRTTAIDACQRDHEVIPAGECVGSGDRAHHEMTLTYVDDHIVPIWSNADLAARLRDV